MKKVIIKDIIVVEGKSDVAFLSSFIEADFVTTNGSDIPQKTIEYLQEQSKKRSIVVLSDPDAPGLRIRSVLDQNINGLRHCFVPKTSSVKNGKVGVAEADKKTILDALSHFVSYESVARSHLTIGDLYELGISGNANSNVLRNKVADAFHLGYVNNKQFLKRAKAMNISKQQIEEAIHEIH
ncbi:MAG: ribonuclease M5 [Bacilli bacterium]